MDEQVPALHPSEHKPDTVPSQGLSQTQLSGQFPTQFHSATTSIAGEEVVLLPQRAMIWPRGNTLLIADFHLGKEATFRAASMPIPDGSAGDIARVDQALAMYPIERLVILGDFFHAKSGRAEKVLDGFTRWRVAHSGLHILLIRGNHDKRAGDPPPEWDIECVNAPYQDEVFVYAHDPAPNPGGYVLAGHIHPGARLVGKGRQEVQLPCFWFGRDIGVLPAFGGFTGLAAIQPAPRDQVFVIAGNSVLQV